MPFVLSLSKGVLRQAQDERPTRDREKYLKEPWLSAVPFWLWC